MARKQTRRGTPKRLDPLSYEAIADAYRKELRGLPGGGPFPDYDLVRLGRYFGGHRFPAITDEDVRDYALRREEQERAPIETINEELQTFLRIQRFAVRHGFMKNEECCRIEFRRIPKPAVPSDAARRRPGDADGVGLRRHRWFKAPAPVGGSRPVDPGPVKPGRRKTDAEDLAAIREQYPRADTESRKWWARSMKEFRKHPGSLGNIERQLKKLGIPPGK